MVALGMSRFGSRASSAASGSSSIARKNQIANGRFLKMPEAPNGNHFELPASGGMFVRLSTLKSVSAATKNTPRTTIDRMQITTVNRIVASIPWMLIPMKMAYPTSHQTCSGMSQLNSSMKIAFM